MTGFGFAETMSGTWARTDGSEGGGRFEFTVEVDSGPLGDFRKSRTAKLRGTIDADGLAAGRPIEGTIEIRPIRGRIIRYELAFTGDDGMRYRFRGQKDIRWSDPLRTWTTLPGEITDAGGRVIGTAETRFDLRQRGPELVRSFRLA